MEFCYEPGMEGNQDMTPGCGPRTTRSKAIRPRQGTHMVLISSRPKPRAEGGACERVEGIAKNPGFLALFPIWISRRGPILG